MNVTYTGERMELAVGGNEETRGKPIWELAVENNKKGLVVRKVNKKYRPVPLT